MNKKVVVFEINNQLLSLPIADVISIERINEVTNIPSSSEVLRGVISLRDKVISIIDLKYILFGEKSDIKSKQILVVNTDGKDFGLLVDKANDIDDVKEKEIQHISLNGKQETVYKRNDKLIMLYQLKDILIHK